MLCCVVSCRVVLCCVVLCRGTGYQEDSNAQTRELLRSSPLLAGLEQRGRVRSLNLSYCTLLSLVDIKRLVEMCGPPPKPKPLAADDQEDAMDQQHTPPKPGSDADLALADRHLETLKLMELDTIRNLAFLHSLYYAWAPYLRVLEVKNCAGLESSDGVLALLEALLGGSGGGGGEAYFVGHEVTWADLFVYPPLADLRATPEGAAVLPRYPRLAAWAARMEQREEARRTYDGTVASQRPPKQSPAKY